MRSGQTEIVERCERYAMTALLVILGLVLGALCLVVFWCLAVNEDVDEQ
jgi:hypothetical protein